MSNQQGPALAKGNLELSANHDSKSGSGPGLENNLTVRAGNIKKGLNPNAVPWFGKGQLGSSNRPKSESDCTCKANDGGTFERYLAAVQMPKLQIFKGNQSDYRTFIRGFDSRVANTLLTDADKLDCLMQYVGGEVRELLEDTDDLPNGIGYAEARILLEKRYGNIHKASTYEQRLMDWPEISYDDADGLQKFTIFANKCANAMSIYEELQYLNHERTLQRLVGKLHKA